MTDRGPYGNDPDPTEVFPPLRDDPSSTPPAGLPPIGTERDPDPTRVMPPTQSDVPTTTMPAAGGPYEPGPPFGGPPGGGGGGGGGDDLPPFEEEPVPWYRQPGPLAALIAGIAAVVVGIIALIMWTGGDDDGGIAGETLPSLATTSTTTTTSPPPTTAAPTTQPATTTSTSTTTTSSTTTTTTTTTTTVPPTTAAPTTQPPTTPAPTTLPPPPTGQALLDEIRANPDLSTLADALACTGLDQDILAGEARTVLAPTDDVFADSPFADPCAEGDTDVVETQLLLHLVSVQLTYDQIFSANELQTLGALIAVNPNTQRVGSAGGVAIVERDIATDPGIVQVVDGLIQGN